MGIIGKSEVFTWYGLIRWLAFLAVTKLDVLKYSNPSKENLM